MAIIRSAKTAHILKQSKYLASINKVSLESAKQVVGAKCAVSSLKERVLSATFFQVLIHVQTKLLLSNF